MANVYPKDIQFLLADHVRQEEGGKLSLLGFYSGDAVLLKGPLPEEIPDGLEGIALPGLTIVAVVRDGHGVFNSVIHLYGPNGKELGEGLRGQKLDKGKEGTANLLVSIQPFPIPGFGIYRVLLELGTHKYEYRFRVGHLDPLTVFPGAKKGKKLPSSQEIPTVGKKPAAKTTKRKL